MTTYDFVREEDRKRKKEKERERERESERAREILKTFIFSNYQNCSNNLNFSTRFKCSETFHTFLQTSTLFTFVYLCLPLLTFVYLWLPLFNWRIYVQILCLLQSILKIKMKKNEKKSTPCWYSKLVSQVA